jgi:hypothetical protein
VLTLDNNGNPVFRVNDPLADAGPNVVPLAPAARHKSHEETGEQDITVIYGDFPDGSEDREFSIPLQEVTLQQ